FFFFSSRRRHTRFSRDWSSDVCSSDLLRDPREAALVPALVLVDDVDDLVCEDVEHAGGVVEDRADEDLSDAVGGGLLRPRLPDDGVLQAAAARPPDRDADGGDLLADLREERAERLDGGDEPLLAGREAELGGSGSGHGDSFEAVSGRSGRLM